MNQQRKYFIRQKYSEQNNANEAIGINELLRKINDDHKVIVEIFERKNKNEIEKHIRDVHWNVDNAKFDSY
ncbi:hypothetical protein [Peribacillus muralis]|uniref:hypothetical protein n=1 Tax=Peribacillus muralis TaxID=264697 RepID=UPI00367317CD